MENLKATTCCGMVFHGRRSDLPDACPICGSEDGSGIGLWRRVDR